MQRHRVVVAHLEHLTSAACEARLEVALVLARAARGAVGVRRGAPTERAALGEVLRARVWAGQLLEDEEAREALDARDCALEDLHPPREHRRAPSTEAGTGREKFKEDAHSRVHVGAPQGGDVHLEVARGIFREADLV